MIVCIAEKPSVAKDIATVIGAQTRRDGYFEGNGYRVTWTFGHLCTLKEPHEYDVAWKRWDLSTLPIIPNKFGVKIIDNPGVKKQFSIIEQLMATATEVINCGDAGQEGELIQRWVMHKANCKCPVKRLWISSLTEEAIRDGFKKLKEEKAYDNLYFAGVSRAVGDWLLGMNATRLYTVKFGSNRQLLSIGRVQTPTLAMVVNRQKEIDNFVSSPFWEIKTVCRETIFTYTDGRFLVEEEAKKVMEQMTQYPLIIGNVSPKDGIESPPRLLDLTTLQVEANRKFGFTAEQSLKTIQSLYEKKLTTYPRVDTTYLSNDIYPKIEGILRGLRDYQELAAPLLSKPIKKSKKVFDDTKVTDHHAIIPTGVLARNLSPDEEKIYDLVTRRFLAAFYPDCKFKSTTINAKVGIHDFKATGKIIIDLGWRVVIKDAPIDGEENQILPIFTVGESLDHEPKLEEKLTQPPKFYTEATILRAMETAGKQVEDDELRDLMKENGIGQPSTRANIIETLFKRGYLVRDKKRIVATPTGIALIDTIENELLKSAELTGIWEKNLRAIEKGNYDRNLFLEEMKTMVRQIVEQVRNSKKAAIPMSEMAKNSEQPKTGDAKEKIEKKNKETTSTSTSTKTLICPICQKGLIVKGKSAFGCTEWKAGCNFRIPIKFLGVDITDNSARKLINAKKVTNVTFKSDEIVGKGSILLNPDGSLNYEMAKLTIPKCPICKTGTIIEGSSAFGCTNWKSGCAFRIAKVIEGFALTQDKISTLIEKKKLTGITYKGQAINGKGELILNPDGTVTPKQKTEEPIKCPVCNLGIIMVGNSAYGCTNWKTGCKFRIPKEISGALITLDHLRQLIAKKGIVALKTNTGATIKLSMQPDGTPIMN